MSDAANLQETEGHEGGHMDAEGKPKPTVTAKTEETAPKTLQNAVTPGALSADMMTVIGSGRIGFSLSPEKYGKAFAKRFGINDI